MYDNEKVQLSGRITETALPPQPHALPQLIDDLYSLLARFENTVQTHSDKIAPILTMEGPSKVDVRDAPTPAGDSDIYMRLNNLGRLLDQQVERLHELTTRVQL